GLRSVALHQFPNGSGFAMPEDDTFWKRALELGIRLSPHHNMGEFYAHSMNNLAGGSGDRPFPAAIVAKVENPPRLCMAQLMAAGVFDRFPSIKFYFAETNASWLPPALFMIDDNYKRYKGWFNVQLPRLPSDYITEHCYFGIINDPLAIEFRDYIPMDRIMWG